MSILICVLFFLFFLISPHYLSRLVRGLGISRVVSDVVICYMVGIIVGNTKQFWLTDAEANTALMGFSEGVATYTVLLALPILITASTVMDIVRNIRPVFVGFALMAVCVTAATLLTAWYYAGAVEGGDKVAGVLSAVYIGGTPNMISVAKGLEMKPELFVVIQATDILCSGLFIVFLTSVARSFYGLFLPPYVPEAPETPKDKDAALLDEDMIMVNEQAQLVQELQAATWQRRAAELLKSGGISLIVIAASVGMAILIPNEEGGINQIVLMMTLTTISVAISGFMGHITSKWITTTESANYILLIFAVAAGSMADFATIIEKGGGYIGFNAMIFVLAIVMHGLLCWICRIRVDVVMISMTAAFFGPGFIPQVSYVLGHSRLLAAGIAAGILGFIIANYIGFAMAQFTAAWFL